MIYAILSSIIMIYNFYIISLHLFHNHLHLYILIQFILFPHQSSYIIFSSYPDTNFHILSFDIVKTFFTPIIFMNSYFCMSSTHFINTQLFPFSFSQPSSFSIIFKPINNYIHTYTNSVCYFYSLIYFLHLLFMLP